MAEYIDRTALGIGYADPKAFINPAHAEGWNTAIQIINEAPVADVVEVVRCKDCKNHEQCSVEFEFANYDPDNAFCWEGKRNG